MVEQLAKLRFEFVLHDSLVVWLPCQFGIIYSHHVLELVAREVGRALVRGVGLFEIECVEV